MNEQLTGREIKRIAIFRALQLGDLLLAVPALRAIRRQFPAAEITLIGLPWAVSFVQRYRRYLDRFVEFAGYPGIKEVAFDARRSEKFIAEQRSCGYDLVVQMHGSGQASNPCALALGGRITAGYYAGTPPAGLAPAAPYPREEHEILRNLGLVALLGCLDLDAWLEFPLYDEDYAEAAALLRKLPRAGRPWIGLHPGARPQARRWPASYFAELGDELARRFDAQIIITGGPEERSTVQKVVANMKTQTLNLAGETSLGGLAALISKLDLFISNDTGPAHIACALDRPSVTIFGPADHRRWSPLDQDRHPIVRFPVACSPCDYEVCPIDHRCLRWLSPAQVLAVAEKHLQPTSGVQGAAVPWRRARCPRNSPHLFSRGAGGGSPLAEGEVSSQLPPSLRGF
jgi:ADP-heptose:LPS heptosyltransferase